ncbi:MAG: right-handed parallel beta-helix repeat-containing protein, partial [Planctomycetota bacterium]
TLAARLAVGFAVLLITTAIQARTVLYVDDDAPAAGDGLTWSTACRFLQDALAGAGAGTEIRVAQGTYQPDRSEASPGGTGDREATFQLVNGVALVGGFAGLGAPDPDERAVDLYETILSGDIADPVYLNDNTYHVVTGSGTDETAVLDGFTISEGYASGYNSETGFLGAGMFNVLASPTINNCTFRENRINAASNEWYPEGGAGMYNENSHPSLVNCTFTGNEAKGCPGGPAPCRRLPGAMYNFNSNPVVVGCTFTENVGGRGGGMHNASSSPTVIDCTFSDNSGSGMFNRDSHPTVIDCTFSGNQGGFGGGMDNGHSSPTVTGCTFLANTAIAAYVDQTERFWPIGKGGGMYNHSDSSPTVMNCTFSGNAANHRGGGMANANSSPTVINNTFSGNHVQGFDVFGTVYGEGGGMFNAGGRPTVTNCTFSANWAGVSGGAMHNLYSGDPTITNCILWDNFPDQVDDVEGLATVAFSNVQGGMAGISNIDADPMFVRIPDPGPDGEWATPDDDYGDLRLQPGSPCIDAGNNWAVADLADTDLDGNPRFADDPVTADSGCGVPVVVDMGAYEFQGDPAEVIYADLTGDGAVGFEDFKTLIGCWSSTQGPCCLADLDLDGNVGVTDFLLVLAYWGPCPEP